jgi:hypothetical protein
LPHPIQDEIVAHLRHNFHSLALFFWNHLDGREVHVVLKPNALVPQKFSVMKTYNMIPAPMLSNNNINDDTPDGGTGDQDSIILNTPAVIAQMVDIGHGLIDSVVHH